MSSKKEQPSQQPHKPLLSAWRFGLWLIVLIGLALIIALVSQPAPVSVIMSTPRGIVDNINNSTPSPTAQPTLTAAPTSTPAPTATPDLRIDALGERMATAEAVDQELAVTVEALGGTSATHTAELDHIFGVFEWVAWGGLFVVGVIAAVLVTWQVVRPSTPAEPPPMPQPVPVAPSVADEFMAAGARRVVLRPHPAPVSEDERRARILARILVERGLLELPTRTAMLREAWPYLNPDRPMPVQLNAGIYNRMINRAIEIANEMNSPTTPTTISSSRRVVVD